MENKIIEILKKYGLYQEFGKHHPESYVKKILDDVAQEISSLLKGEGEYYQKVYIKSEADLPRDGIYIAHYKGFDIDSPAGTIISNYDHLNPCKRLNWLERIDWYLQPVSLPDKELIAKSGKKYRSIPDDVDLETWDNMTVAERLHYKNLIITNNNDVVLEEHTVKYEIVGLESELANLKK